MKILASFDDCVIEDLTAASLMQKYSIPTIFYWPVYPLNVNEPSGRRSLPEGDQYELSKYFLIGSHGINHKLLTRIEPYIAWAEINESRKILSNRFGQEIDTFCYPRGYANSDIQKMVQEAGYTSARSTLVGYIHQSENPYFIQTAVHIGQQRKEYGGIHWLKYAFNLLEEALKTPDSIFHFWGHSWEIEKNNAWGDLELLLKAMS